MPSSHNFREQIELLDMPPGKKKTLLAAIELFSQQGYAATSTAQIAKKAGVSEATIFKYFKTKAQLLNELLQPLLEQLIPKYQSEFIEKISQQKFVDVKDFTLAVITDRYNFLVANQQLIAILLGQILIDDSLRKNAVAVGLENSQKFNKEFQKIFAQYFDAPELTLFEFFTKIIRLLFGYFMQQKFMNDSLPVEPTHDLEILAQQLLISLTS